MCRMNKLTACILIFCLLLMIISPSFAQERRKQEPVLCSKCSTKNNPTAKFCSKCGTKLLKQIIKLEHKEKIPETIPPEEPALKQEPGAVIPPVVREEAVPLTADELKAKTIYDHGAVLFKKRDHYNAAVEFNKIVENYPSTKYAEAASLMLTVCNGLIRMNILVEKIEAEQENKENKKDKKDGASPFVAGFLGGIVGIGVSFFVLLLLLSGN